MSPILGSRGGLSASAYGLFGAAAGANSYESISTVTVSTAVSSITFSSIPATYKHLQIRYLAKTSRAAVNDYAKLEINADTTAANYRSHTLNADGASVYAGTAANATEIGGFPGNTNASMFGVGILDFLDYTNTNKYKTIRMLDGFDQNSASTGAAYVALESGLWMSSSAITSIKITPGTGPNFVQYSSFALYGIKG
jgi:hypothetical protein